MKKAEEADDTKDSEAKAAAAKEKAEKRGGIMRSHKKQK